VAIPTTPLDMTKTLRREKWCEC